MFLFFYAKNNMSNHFVKDHSSIVRTIVAQKMEREKNNALLQMENACLQNSVLPVWIGANKRSAPNEIYVSIIIIMDTHTHTQGENQKKACNKLN